MSTTQSFRGPEQESQRPKAGTVLANVAMVTSNPSLGPPSEEGWVSQADPPQRASPTGRSLPMSSMRCPIWSRGGGAEPRPAPYLGGAGEATPAGWAPASRPLLGQVTVAFGPQTGRSLRPTFEPPAGPCTVDLTSYRSILLTCPPPTTASPGATSPALSPPLLTRRASGQPSNPGRAG